MIPLTLVGQVLTSLTTGYQHGNYGVNLGDGENDTVVHAWPLDKASVFSQE